MTILTTIAVSASILVLGIGLATLLQERGYRFDLRRRRPARSVGGGRREHDTLLEARRVSRSSLSA